MQRFVFFILVAVSLTLTTSFAQQQDKPYFTFVIVHGAWGGSWDWRVVDSLLTARGHRVVLTQLTGLGDRIHLASPNIGLAIHIEDVVNTILWQQLDNVILLGHSYGGMVITGVADRIPNRIRRLVYLDAFLPESGESVQGLTESKSVKGLIASAKGGFIVPIWVTDTTVVPRDTPQPLRTFTDTLFLANPSTRLLPGTYILTFEPDKLPDSFQPYADRAATRGWRVLKLQSNHVPERTAQIPLVDLLETMR